MLLRVVGSCCAKFETGQTFSYLQTDVTTPNNVGPTLLGVVGQKCCVRLHRALGYVHTVPVDFRPLKNLTGHFVSHETVQYFLAVHTELSNQVEF